MSSPFSLAQQLHAQGRLEAARPLYEQCLREAPGDWRVLTRLGLLNVQERRFDEAVEVLQRALAANPANPEAHAWLGEALRHGGRLEAAIAAFRQALALQPGFAPAWFNLGLALGQVKDFEAAEAAWRQFLQLREDNPRVRRELASVALARGDVAQAAAWMEQHLARFPRDAEAVDASFQVGAALDRQAHLPSAIAWFERAAALAPDRADIQNALAVAHHNFAQHGEALRHYRRALELKPDFAEVHSNLLMALHYVDPDDCEAMFREHLAWAARHVADVVPAAPGSFANTPDADRRLRIGYVSPRLFSGSVARNFLPLLEARDRSRFHVTCYATSDVHDETTAQLRSLADAWRDAATLDDAALLRVIREDAIDVLVDLCGHCPGHRLRMFAHRAAPIQMTWLDYSNTTGIAAMDYLVGDPLETPAGSPQRYTEEVVRLPDMRLAYRPPVDLPGLVAPPVTRKGFVTFGCINRLSKLNDRLIGAWSRILEGVPGSRLLLKGNAYASPEVRADVQRRFARHGIAADRLDLRAASDERQMMIEYGDIDVCLDPFPYNGSTTTCDALLMGVPVVSLAGVSLVARAGLMFLTACGLPEWVARDEEAYVRLACEAARDPARLARLRPELRERFLASPICDSARFARAFEEIYRAVWRLRTEAASRGAQRTATPK
jgi:predicted O-linked N-acetylglucosamine transferase (SPINDLY family)